MELLLIMLIAGGASVLTFFSGFGLGTILMPFMAIFFPVEAAIAVTGIVHLLNNLFKFGLVRQHIDWQIAARFGIAAVVGALLGAGLLSILPQQGTLLRWHMGPRVFEVQTLKLVVSSLMFAFVVFELLPGTRTLEFGKDKLLWGGMLSGFFGGLTGHQGALRSAFLVRFHLTKEVFIATGIVIACAVDITRLSVYATRFKLSLLGENWNLLLAASSAALIGAWIGNRMLAKVTLGFVQYTVSVLVFLLALLLGSGVL